MSQKRSDFQSKPRFGGGKPGGKKFGGKKFGGKSAGHGFGKKFEGDRKEGGEGFERRPPRDKGSFGDKPRFDRGDKPRFDRGDKPRFNKDGDRGGKPRFEGAGKPRFDRADRGPGDRKFDDRPRKPRFDRDDRGGKPRFEGGGKPRFDRDDRGGKPRFDRGDKPRFDRADKPRFDKGGDDRPRKPRFDSDKPRFDRGDKPRFEGGGKPRFDRDDRGGKPRFDRGDKPRFDRGDKPRFDRGDKPRFDKGGDRPYSKGKSFGDKKFGDKKSFEEREDRAVREGHSRRPQKSWQRYDDRPRRPEGEGREERGPASFETREKLKSARSSYGAPSSAFLYGVHAVTEALLNPKRMHQRLLCTPGGYAAIEGACRKALEKGINLPEVIYVEKDDIARLLPRDAVHQDILLDAQPLEEVFLVDIINTLAEDAKVLVLDQVTDPHNVGAIIRSAAAFGAAAVVVQKLNAPDITGTLAKAASGAVEHVPVVREVNLSRAIEQLKEAGFTCLGLAEEGKRTLSETGTKGRVAIVLGAEGEGLRRLVAETCDELVRLPTQGAIGSLNVSNAAAVALYEAAR